MHDYVTQFSSRSKKPKKDKQSPKPQTTAHVRSHWSSKVRRSNLILDALKGEADVLLRRPGANKRDKPSDSIAMSVAHDSDQVFQELSVVVQLDFLLGDLLAAPR